jgi:hypothetical protein
MKQTPVLAPRLAPLSKSEFMSGEQCEKRLVLEKRHPDLAEDMTEHEASLLEAGIAVGERARARWPGGVLVGERGGEAVARTRALMADASVPAIFEAAFAGGRVRVDILERTDDGRFDLVEVKSGTRVKPEYVTDAAYQRFILSDEGVPLRATRVMHPNPEYLYEGRAVGLDLDRFFVSTDVTPEAEEMADAIAQRARIRQKLLAFPVVPPKTIGSHCNKPPCPFKGHCSREWSMLNAEPEQPITRIPRLSERQRGILSDQNIADIRRIPPGMKDSDQKPVLTAAQERFREMISGGEVRFDREGFNREMKNLVFPVYSWDIETVAPTIPAFPNTRPGQAVTFMYSLHALHEDGRIDPHVRLHADRRRDPHPVLIEKLLRDVGDKGSILIISGYEDVHVRAWQTQYPVYADRLEALRGRLVDLQAVLRRHYLSPTLKNYSLKSLIKEFLNESYDNLSIKNGAEAAAAYMESIAPDTPPARRAEIHVWLRNYVYKDTETPLRVLLALAPDLIQQDTPAESPTAARRRAIRATRKSKPA